MIDDSSDLKNTILSKIGLVHLELQVFKGLHLIRQKLLFLLEISLAKDKEKAYFRPFIFPTSYNFKLPDLKPLNILLTEP